MLMIRFHRRSCRWNFITSAGEDDADLHFSSTQSGVLAGSSDQKGSAPLWRVSTIYDSTFQPAKERLNL